MSQTENGTGNNSGKVILRVIPLGGLGAIGKNMLALEAGDDIIIIDAGLMFPTSEMHGIDIVIPDAGYVIDRADKVRALIVTHGHEDHIGAIPYLLEEGLNVPIYATGIARGLLEGKLREQKLLGEAKLNTITADDRLKLGVFDVEFFHICHSFPDSVGVSVQTPAGRVIHTSDYRFDPTPVDGRLTEEEKLRKWGDEGVLLLMADSTNAEKAETTPSERTLDTMLDNVLSTAPGRVLFATFASNLGRVRQIIEAAGRHERRVGMIGRSMVGNTKIGIQLGYLPVTQDDLLDADEMEDLPAKQVVVIATGSQGEPTSAMVRMSVGDHRQITLRAGDTVVLSATPIPGNEELFNRTVDNLFRQGVDVFYHQLGDVHVSGHGGRQDYCHMMELVRPKFFIPIHGEYRHLILHGRLAEQSGIAKNNIYVVEDGQIVEFFRPSGKRKIEGRLGEKLNISNVYVDGLGVGDVGNVVLRDRRHLSQDGFIVCVVAVDEVEGDILYGPEILSRGFVYMRDNEELFLRAQDIVNKILKKKGPVKVLEDKIKEALASFAHKEMGRRPMVMPLVIEV